MNSLVNSICADRGGGLNEMKNLLDRHTQTVGQTEVPGPAVAKRSGVPAVVQTAIHNRNKNKKEDASRTSSIALVSLQECYLDTEALSRISDSLNC